MKYRLYYHVGSENHGCEAIVRSTAKILNTDLILYSRNPDSDRSYGIDKVVKLKEDTNKPVEYHSVKWFIAALHYKLTNTDYIAIKYAHREFFSQVREGDICLSIGGDNYCYSGQDIIGYYNRVLHEKRAKTVLWGCSVEPDVLTPEVVDDIQRYDLICARESLSYQALKNINPNTILVADPAFQLDRIDLPLPDGFAENNTVGINVSPLIMKCESDVGITFQNYVALIEFILASTDMHIALIPHVVAKENDDRKPLQILFEKYKDSGRVVLIDDNDCMKLKGYIARCRFFVGARTHATIAAYSTCVPTLVVGYSIKATGIANDIFGTYKNYVLPVQSLKKESDLTNAFRWLYDNEESVRDHLMQTIPYYCEKALTAIDFIKNLVI